MPTPFHYITITYKVELYALAESSDTLPLFLIYHYVYPVPYRIALHGTLPYHAVPYHTIPHHTIPYHSIQNHPIRWACFCNTFCHYKFWLNAGAVFFFLLEGGKDFVHCTLYTQMVLPYQRLGGRIMLPP